MIEISGGKLTFLTWTIKQSKLIALHDYIVSEPGNSIKLKRVSSHQG